MTFTKLFSSITESTIWCEPSDTRIVWITMLAMADRKGRVFGSVPGLANRAQVPVAAVRTALESFLSPDPDSRTPDHEGRRIEPMDGGWRLLNHGKYRAIRDEEERRAYKTEKQREYRQPVDNVDTGGLSLTAVVPSGPEKTGVDTNGHNAEAEAESNTPQSPKGGKVVDVKKRDELKAASLRIGALFNRRPETLWTEKERKALIKLYPIPEDDMQPVERYYTASIPSESDFRRREVVTLLNNWPGELDKARKFLASGTKNGASGHSDNATLRPFVAGIDESHFLEWYYQTFPNAREGQTLLTASAGSIQKYRDAHP